MDKNMNFEKWYEKKVKNLEINDPKEYKLYRNGWYSALVEVFKVLGEPLKNADMSEDCCDERYLDKIRKL